MMQPKNNYPMVMKRDIGHPDLGEMQVDQDLKQIKKSSGHARRHSSRMIVDDLHFQRLEINTAKPFGVNKHADRVHCENKNPI